MQEQSPVLLRVKSLHLHSVFLKIEPRSINYLQPDFRLPDEIDASGGAKALPLSLVVRRVEREAENHLSGDEVRNIVGSLYLMYGADFRAAEMAAPLKSLSHYPDRKDRVALVLPTACGAS